MEGGKGMEGGRVMEGARGGVAAAHHDGGCAVGTDTSSQRPPLSQCDRPNACCSRPMAERSRAQTSLVPRVQDILFEENVTIGKNSS